MVESKERKPWSRRRRVLVALGGAALLATLFLAWADRAVAAAGEGRIHDAVADVPRCDAALVLGTSPGVEGRGNAFFEARLDAAAALHRAGVVRTLLVSGDNSRSDYDEPSCMRDGLVARGVPVGDITCDFAGRSTLDSIGRAKPVFGHGRVIIVSQRFHLERALYLARAAGLDAEGFVAADPRAAARVRVREILARGKAVLDVALGRQPWVLGSPE